MTRKSIQIIRRIDFHIYHKSTGSPKNFAHKLGICERSLFDILQLMKENKAPVKYDKHRESYYYESNGFFVFGFIEKRS